MATHGRRSIGVIWAVCALSAGLPAAAHADEIWVAPTYQQDLGGLGVGMNTTWPATQNGAVRLAWAIPASLQAFQGAKLLLIPSWIVALACNIGAWVVLVRGFRS